MYDNDPAKESQPKNGLRIVHDPIPVSHREAEAEAEAMEPYYQDIAERQIALMRRALKTSE